MKNSNETDMLFLRTRGRKVLGVSAHFGSFADCVRKMSREMRVKPAIRKQQGQRTAIWAGRGLSLWVFQPRSDEPVCCSVMVRSLPTKRKP